MNTFGDHMKILGAVLAGGQSRRFGQDKAIVVIDGIAMFDHVMAALSEQVDQVVVCGRDWNGLVRVEDRPAAGIGPLGGLNGALAYARAHGFDAVVTLPVDVLPVPKNLVELLQGAGPSVFEEQHLIGFWPVECSEMLDGYLAISHGGAFRGWLDHANVRKLPEPHQLHNVNSPDDLAAYIEK
tara:strand:+ start:23654 stop:24202 length:549 start_codon:yes stop_codon:yes gene_type:complete